MGLAIILAVAATVAVSGTRAPRPAMSWLTVTGPDQVLIARSPIEQGGAFVLRYRNSLYGSLAEERFVMQHGEMVLVGLAADEVAVLDEYYHTDRPPRRSAGGGQRAWSAAPALQVRLRQLHVAATDLGRRTLLVPGQPAVELWRFVDDRSPTVTLSVEGGSG
jgi:hypothetical protein